MFKRFRNVMVCRGSVGADHSGIGAGASGFSAFWSTSRPMTVDVNDFEIENDGSMESAVIPGAYCSYTSRPPWITPTESARPDPTISSAAARTVAGSTPAGSGPVGQPCVGHGTHLSCRRRCARGTCRVVVVASTGDATNAL